eukprot:1361003-Pyramimonas_sp.AAC.1
MRKPNDFRGRMAAKRLRLAKACAGDALPFLSVNCRDARFAEPSSAVSCDRDVPSTCGQPASSEPTAMTCGLHHSFATPGWHVPCPSLGAND